jgi:hypothetical protein
MKIATLVASLACTLALSAHASVSTGTSFENGSSVLPQNFSFWWPKPPVCHPKPPVCHPKPPTCHPRPPCVPEPESYALMGAGLLGVAFVVRRRRAK